MGLFFVFSITVILTFTQFAHAQLSRQQTLMDLTADYRKRFTTGQYKSNATLIKEFNLKQDEFAAAMKSTGGLRKVFFLQNDYEKDFTVTLYAFVDEQGSLLGIFREKSKYFDEEERSYLRLSSLVALSAGLNFIPIGGTNALSVKGFHFSAAAGGTLQFSYLKNFRDKTFGNTNLFLVNRAGAWGLYSEQSNLVTTGLVQVWTGFLNGGVKEFILR